jgi:hypothetical protein
MVQDNWEKKKGQPKPLQGFRDIQVGAEATSIGKW